MTIWISIGSLFSSPNRFSNLSPFSFADVNIQCRISKMPNVFWRAGNTSESRNCWFDFRNSLTSFKANFGSIIARIWTILHFRSIVFACFLPYLDTYSFSMIWNVDKAFSNSAFITKKVHHLHFYICSVLFFNLLQSSICITFLIKGEQGRTRAQRQFVL